MAVKTLVSPEEYLAGGYENPEPDFVDGVLVKRAQPNDSHSRVFGNIYEAFLEAGAKRFLVARSEIRMRVAARRYRVADLAYFVQPPASRVPDAPPLIVFEILSPDDRFAELKAKCQDYERFGVTYIFLADPEQGTLSRYSNGNLLTVGGPVLEIAEFGLTIPLARLFA